MGLGAIALIGLYVACELIANVTASRPVAMGAVAVPSAVFIVALTFTLLDLINERFGKEGAKQVVYVAFLANLLLAAYIQFVITLPVPTFDTTSEAFAGALGSTPRIVFASLTAYLVSSLVDAEIFAWWRQRVGGYRWARVLISNAFSTLADSIVFISLGFWGVMPVLPLIQGQYIVKMGVTLVSIPLIYLIRARREEGITLAPAG